jgi:hypothetical protein
MVKMLFMGNPGGKIRQGRNRERWLDNAGCDLRLKVRIFRLKAYVMEELAAIDRG